MKELQLSHKLFQHENDSWIVLNEDRETVGIFSESGFEEAKALWWSLISKEEQEEWEEYWLDIEAAADNRRADQAERRLLACDR